MVARVLALLGWAGGEVFGMGAEAGYDYLNERKKE